MSAEDEIYDDEWANVQIAALTNPFLNPLIAVDNGGPLDAVEAWEEAKLMFDPWAPNYDDKDAAGDRLAAALVRTRAMVVALEQEAAALHALVERSVGASPAGWYSDACDYLDADRVLAAGGEDESE